MKTIVNNLFLILLLVFSNALFSQFGEAEKLVANYSSPYAINNFDIDGDGDEDYVAGYWKNILWYENVGEYEFQLGRYITAANGLTGLVNADLNADGFTDLIFVDGDGLYRVFGAEAGMFGDAVLVLSLNGKGVDVADIDGDGDLDVVVTAIGAPRVIWFSNDGEGNLEYMTYLGVYEGYPNELCTSDLDGDGDYDVAVVYRDKVAWYENDGAGVFGPQTEIDGSLPDGSYIVSGDVDGDGDMDLVASGSNGEYYTKVAYYENDGTGAFTLELINSSSWPVYNDLELFDYNEDGYLDVLTADSYRDVIKGYPFDGLDFGDAVIIDNPNNCNVIRILDADGDENIDLVTSRVDDGAGGSGDIILLKNNGGGTFEDVGFINNSVHGIIKEVITTDLNSDGHIDVLYVQNKKVEYVRNTGATGFDQRIVLEDELNALLVGAGDINGDGYVDVVLTDFIADELLWLENDGEGNFGDPQLIYDEIESEQVLVVDDLNGDGFADVLCALNDKILAFMNEGEGVFGSPIILLEGLLDLVDILSFDSDDDGDKEIFSFSSVTLELFYFENLDGVSFGPLELIAELPNDQIDLDFGDINGDGQIDLASMVWFGDSEVYWYPNDGGTFGDPIYVGPGPELGKGLKVMDLDADGDQDIGVVSNYVLAEEFGWFENFGGGTFSDEYIFVASADAYMIFGADFDEDGDVDPGVVSINDDYLAIYENLYYSNLQIKGNLFVDLNLNGFLDSADVGMSYTNVSTTPESDFAFTAPSGAYFMNFVDTSGTYLLAPNEIEHWSVVTDSLTYSIFIGDFFTAVDSLDFGFYPDTVFDAITADIVGGFPRCNQEVNYWLNIENIGTTVPSGKIKLTLDDSLTYISSAITPDSIVGQNIYWSFDSLMYFSNYQINLHVQMPDFLSEGDTLTSTLFSTVDSLEGMVFSTTAELEQILRCAYDPNDKIATPAGTDNLGYIPIGVTELDYTIRFQNTGSDTAFTVIISDQLDTNLNWESIELLSTSHFMDVEVNYDGEVEFRFENIMLPDSIVDEPASHGYVRYRIHLNEGLDPGTSIYNTANIYFDANPAVVTNTKINTLYDCESVLSLLNGDSVVCEDYFWEAELINAPSTIDYLWTIDEFMEENEPNVSWMADTAGTFNITLSIATDFCATDTTFELMVIPKEINNLVGAEICSGDSLFFSGDYFMFSGTYYDTLISVTGCDSILIQELIVFDLPVIFIDDIDEEIVCLESGPVELSAMPTDGVFSGAGMASNIFQPNEAGIGDHTIYYSLTDENGCSSKDSILISVVSCLGVSKLNHENFTIFPNPFSNYTTINFNEPLTENHTILIHDILGKEVYRNENVTGTSLEIKKEQLGVGVYILSFYSPESEKLMSTKLVVE
ncbi:FG-GAP-like repeat-containing protein [Crocinitomix catalasitica]|uniref:FG-GAP-like repeat-containing protein n=1 Tax=Crocinitomix catalasitica TaxID=184607 RepID=UPI000486D9B9|nr:FG-GAP-like repeat-containing protein [Crocinitomix catalasitica]